MGSVDSVWLILFVVGFLNSLARAGFQVWGFKLVSRREEILDQIEQYLRSLFMICVCWAIIKMLGW